MTCYEKISLLVQFSIFIATSIYAWFAWGQWRSIAHQADIATRMHRPWIMVTPDNPNGWPTKDRESFPFRFKWLAENVGESPAFLTKVYVAMGVADFPIPDKKPQYQEPNALAKFILRPNGKHQGEAGATLTQPEIINIVNGQQCIVFYGFIDYHDTANKIHKTRFCSYWHQGGELRRFSPVGPPSWTDYT